MSVRGVFLSLYRHVHFVDEEDGFCSLDNVLDPFGESPKILAIGVFAEVPVLWTPCYLTVLHDLSYLLIEYGTDHF